MKRASQEPENHDGDHSDGDVDQQEEGSYDPTTGQLKRINMPKKSKHRTRAHVNPMGDLNIPT